MTFWGLVDANYYIWNMDKQPRPPVHTGNCVQSLGIEPDGREYEKEDIYKMCIHDWATLL